MIKYILASIALLLFISCKENKSSTNSSTSVQPQISSTTDTYFIDMPVDQYLNKYKSLPAESKMLLDVRTPPEFNDGNIPGSVMINYLDTDIDNQLAALDKSKTYFVYCQVGGRSKKCMDKMQQMGFTKVVNLAGGYEAYAAASK